VILAALFGLLGRGFLARATVAARDGSMRVQYDRIARYSTPSVLRVEFGGAAVHDRRVQLWVSDDLLKSLGNQRVTPEPTASVLDSGGVLYTFPVLTSPTAVQFALQPLRAGIQHVTLRVPGSSSLGLSVAVWP